MAVHRSGSGPDVVLFHGGMGSWKHWIRNIEPLAARFTVHALDHPGYCASAPGPRETSGAAIAANFARRLTPRVTHLCLISPAGSPLRRFVDRPTRSYKEAGDDERLFREICRHNLLVNMLSDPASVIEETVDIQADCVRRTRFNSRKVSGGGTLLGEVAQLTCRIRLLWGERDDSPFRPADLLIGEIREAVGALDAHRVPRAGHWSAYENASEVNRLMLEFFSS